MLKQNPALIAGRGMPVAITCGDPAIAIDNANFIANLIAQAVQNPSLPANPPFEVHPYKALLPLQNYEKYIIGTFPPISYVLDNLAVVAAGITSLSQPGGVFCDNAPNIPFYHGNLPPNNPGSMWNYFLTAGEQAAIGAIPNRNLKAVFLTNKLNNLRVNYADIIDTVQRNLNNGNYNASDSNLRNICPNKGAINHVLENEKVEAILFNTSSTFSVDGLKIHTNVNPHGLPGQINVNNKGNSFDLFIRACQERNFTIEFRITNGAIAHQFPWTTLNLANAAFLNGKLANKIAFEVRITNQEPNFRVSKEFFAITPFSPAAANRGNTRLNQIVATWLLANPGQTSVNLLYRIYQAFRNANWPFLYGLNV